MDLGPSNTFPMPANMMLTVISRRRWRDIAKERFFPHPGSGVLARWAARQLLWCRLLWQAHLLHCPVAASSGQQLAPARTPLGWFCSPMPSMRRLTMNGFSQHLSQVRHHSTSLPFRRHGSAPSNEVRTSAWGLFLEPSLSALGGALPQEFYSEGDGVWSTLPGALSQPSG